MISPDVYKRQNLNYASDVAVNLNSCHRQVYEHYKKTVVELNISSSSTVNPKNTWTFNQTSYYACFAQASSLHIHNCVCANMYIHIICAYFGVYFVHTRENK